VSDNQNIEALFTEDRKFPPPPEFAAQANCDQSIYDAAKDRDAFWAKQAERVTWRKKWDTV
jgi:acetyl-CoA synthetase